MNQSVKTIMTAAAIGSVLFMQNAQAEHEDYQCKVVPKEQMKSQQELHKKLTAQGWRVRQIKVVNGCYEVYGVDEKNAKVESFFNPVNLESVKVGVFSEVAPSK